MTRYWVITPHNSTRPKEYENAWEYDRINNTVAIGWTEMGDISDLPKEEIRARFEDVYAERGESWIKYNKTKVSNVLWDFYNTIEEGDIIIAREGRKKLIGIGKVIGAAYYSEEEGAKRTPNAENKNSNFIKVKWDPQIIEYETLVFSIFTLYEIDEKKYYDLTEIDEEIKGEEIITQREQVFALEKYLEHFIVKNFDTIFENRLELWKDEEGNTGQQYPCIDEEGDNIGIIDILAKKKNENSFIIIELKKGKSSDKVVGQIKRYMNWVKENLCKGEDRVEGLIICKDKDKKLEWSLKDANDIKLKFYEIKFELKDD